MDRWIGCEIKIRLRIRVSENEYTFDKGKYIYKENKYIRVDICSTESIRIILNINWRKFILEYIKNNCLHV